MLKYKREILIDLKDDFESEAKSILLKLEYILRREGFHTSKDLNKIQFKRIYIPLMYGNAKYIFKDGRIQLLNINKKKIKLIFNVSLNYLTFMALTAAIVLPAALYFFEGIDSLTVSMIGVIIFLFFFGIGTLILRLRVNELIKLCI